MNLKKQAFKGIVWTGIQQWGRYIASIVSFAVLAHILSAKDIGLVALATTSIWFIQLLFIDGFSNFIIQRENVDAEHLNTSFWINLSLGAIFTLLLIASSNQIANIVGEVQLSSVMKWLSPSILLYSLSTIQEAILRREFAFKNLAMRTLIAALISSVVAIIMAFKGFGIWSLVIQQLLNSVMQLAILWYISSWRPNLSFSFEYFKEMLEFEVNVLGAKFVQHVTQTVIQFAIAYFLGATSLGYYSLAQRLLIAMNVLFINVVNQVALPTFSRLQDNLTELRRSFHKVTHLMLTVAMPSFFGLIVIAPEATHAIYGQQWDQSIPIIRILAFGGIAESILILNGTLMVSLGNPNLQMRVTALANFLYAVIFSVTIQMGIVAAASAYSAAYLIALPLSYWLVRRLTECKTLEYLRLYITPILLSAVVVFVSFAIKINWPEIRTDFKLILCILFSTASYLLAVLFLEPKLFSNLYKVIKSPSH